jgi:hypothetical protein
MSDESAADFLQDQLKALLASPALSRHGTSSNEPAASEEHDTEPSIDVQRLRDALRMGLNK